MTRLRRETKTRAIPSEFGFRHLAELLKEDPSIDKVVVYARVSERDQDRKGNLYRQIANLVSEVVLTHQLEIVAIYSTVASGSLRHENERLITALRHARRLGVPLVAESAPRFIRSIYYDSNANTDAWPSKGDFSEFRDLAQGVTLATVWHPDLAPSEIRHLEQARGNRFQSKHRSVSRRAQRRAAFANLAFRLHFRDVSLTDLAYWFSVSRSTVQEWVK